MDGAAGTGVDFIARIEHEDRIFRNHGAKSTGDP